MRPAVSGDHYMLGLPTLKPEAAKIVRRPDGGESQLACYLDALVNPPADADVEVAPVRPAEMGQGKALVLDPDV